MGQVVQLVGAVLIVGAYVAAQQKRLRFDSVQFLAMNAIGAGILTVVAAVNRDLGFLLLEGVWTWVSARGLRRAIQAEKAKKTTKTGKPSGPFSRPPGRPARRRHRHNPLRRV
jgi:hypothetical protein